MTVCRPDFFRKDMHRVIQARIVSFSVGKKKKVRCAIKNQAIHNSIFSEDKYWSRIRPCVDSIKKRKVC